MSSAEISPSQARLKLAILSKKAEAKDHWQFYSEMIGLGLPDEVIEILQKILKVTSKVAGTIISIGKVIVSQLLDYVAKHPLQVAGLAIGLCATYGLGVALNGLLALNPTLAGLPLLGPQIIKLITAIYSLCKIVVVPIMIASPIVGAVFGDIFDKKNPEVSESLQRVAKDFFDLFSKIINAIKHELELGEWNEAFS